MITFAQYMNRVLYGPAGYYSTGTAKTGKSGDYFTAPDVGPVFGRLLAEIFMRWRDRLGPETFSLIEAGAGEGKLARDLLESLSSLQGAVPLSFTAVERSEARLKNLEGMKAPPGISFTAQASLSALPKNSVAGVLFANELIDAFAVHRVQQKNGRLRELFVDEAGDRRRFLWKSPSTPKLQAYFDRLGIVLPEDYETEVNLAMSVWLTEAAEVLKKGLVVLIDYGRPAYDYYAPERTRGTLRAFSNHKVSADFLDPGRLVDLTADVDFTSLALDAREAGFAPLAFMEMGTFLMTGVASVIESRAGTRPAPTGLRYLLHPEGLGGAFHVLILGKNVATEDWGFEHNRIGRLGLDRPADHR